MIGDGLQDEGEPEDGDGGTGDLRLQLVVVGDPEGVEGRGSVVAGLVIVIVGGSACGDSLQFPCCVHLG